MSNSDFIEVLENTAKKLNKDIAYQSLSNDAKSISIYKTNNTKDFMNINSCNNIQQITDKQCISTLSSVKGYQIIPLYISSFVRNTTIFTFDKCVNHNLAATSFMVKEDDADEFVSALNAAGINAELNVVSITFLAIQYNELNYSFCIFLMVLLAIFISFIDNAKTHTLKRLEGYSSIGIMAEESLSMILVLLGIFATVEAVGITLFAIHNVKILDGFIMFNINSLLKIYLPIIVFVVLLASLTVICHSNNLYIKGKVNKGFILCAAAVIKTITFVFMCAPFTIAVTLLPGYINTYTLSVQVHDLLSSYVELSFNDGLDENSMLKFYNAAVNEYDAVLFMNNYQPENLEYISKYFEQNYNVAPELNTYDYQRYVQCFRLTINSNYLNLNPLHKPDGELITKKDFSDDKYNILVAENAEHTNAFVKYIQVWHKMFSDYKPDEELPINIVYYKSDEKFLMISPQSNQMYAESPYVTVVDGLNQKVDNYYTGVLFSTDSSFILLKPKSAGDNLYYPLVPLFEKTGVENAVNSVTYANDRYAEELAHSRNLVVTNLIQVLIYAGLYVFIMIYFIETYSENYRNDIAVRKLSGEGFFRLHSRYFSAVALMVAVTMAGVLINQKDYIAAAGFSLPIIAVPLALWFIEILIFALYSSRLTHKNILKALKGGEV